MKRCEKCKNEFNPRVLIDGKLHTLYRRRFCLECSPFGQHNTTDLANPSPTATIDKLSEIEFVTLIKSSSSRSEIFSKLKLRKGGEAFKIINRRIKREGLDVSHFIEGGRTGAKGNNRIYSNEEVYCQNSKMRNGIRKRVMADNFMPYHCGICQLLPTWNGMPLTLALDHINGDRNDNRKENLRWSCPNCHTQTPTFGAKRRLTFSRKSI